MDRSAARLGSRSPGSTAHTIRPCVRRIRVQPPGAAPGRVPCRRWAGARSKTSRSSSSLNSARLTCSFRPAEPDLAAGPVAQRGVATVEAEDRVTADQRTGQGVRGCGAHRLVAGLPQRCRRSPAPPRQRRIRSSACRWPMPARRSPGPTPQFAYHRAHRGRADVTAHPVDLGWRDAARRPADRPRSARRPPRWSDRQRSSARDRDRVAPPRHCPRASFSSRTASTNASSEAETSTRSDTD